jgi:integrase
MAGSVTFILKDPGTKKDRKDKGVKKATPVYLVFWYGQDRIKLSTGEKILPKYWNPETHRARETAKYPAHENLNNRLKYIEEGVLQTARDHLSKNAGIILNKLAEEFKTILKPVPVNDPGKVTFFSAIQEYIRTANKRPRTLISYGSTLHILQDYQKTLKRDLIFEDINQDFYEEFVKYLTYTVQYDRKPKTGGGETVKTGYSLNTIGKCIKNLKVFMNYALDKGYTTNRGHLHKKFRKPEETADTIYLNDQELLTLYEKDLSDNPRLDRVRDLFIIGCYTGLRFSDLSQLTPGKFIKGGTRLKLKTVKTGETVEIPLHWTIKEILKKYNGNTPRAISNQKMNEYLKDLGKLAKIDERITLTKTEAGLNFDKSFEKWELISVHTARRSFSTNMYLAEVPTISIMKITGHRTERAFLKYIKITQEQNADKLSRHPYFSKSPLKLVNQ